MAERIRRLSLVSRPPSSSAVETMVISSSSVIPVPSPAWNSFPMAFCHRLNRAVRGRSNTNMTFREGVTPMATDSAWFLAKVFGEISPKVRMARVSTTVERTAPYSRKKRVKSTVPRVEAVMLTMLLPTRMVESRRSKSSASARADAARRLPSSALFRRRILFREEKAVSVAEK